MRIYLQSLSDDNKAPRFCHLHLQEDLIEGWTLIRELGYQGQAGKVTRTHFDSHAEALQAMMELRDAQLRKGFSIVFAQGEIVE